MMRLWRSLLFPVLGMPFTAQMAWSTAFEMAGTWTVRIRLWTCASSIASNGRWAPGTVVVPVRHWCFRCSEWRAREQARCPVRFNRRAEGRASPAGCPLRWDDFPTMPNLRACSWRG